MQQYFAGKEMVVFDSTFINPDGRREAVHSQVLLLQWRPYAFCLRISVWTCLVCLFLP